MSSGRVRRDLRMLVLCVYGMRSEYSVVRMIEYVVVCLGGLG